MIECEGCEGWFHPKCVGVSESEVDEIKNWKCVECGAPAATEVVAAGQASLQADGPDGETLPPLGTC